MKILNQQQIREADAFTIEHEAIASIDLMERAARLFVKALLKKYKTRGVIHIFCGKGNNGGDGLVAARLLLHEKYRTKTCIIEYSSHASDDFISNYERLKSIESAEIIHLNSDSEFPIIDDNDIIIDAMWGSGLSRPIGGFSRSIIEKINQSKAKVIAVDIPSGIFCDCFNPDSAIIKANYTISFQSPKLSFFIPENQDFVQNWICVDIGLNKTFIDKQTSNFYLTEKSEIKKLLLLRKNFDHKGKFGHALLISGSTGKMGAAILSASSCMRTGVGLLTICIPKSGNPIIQIVVPEAMSIPDTNENFISEIPDLSNYSAIGIGPGIGTKSQTIDAFQILLKQLKVPVVIDADAINILSQNPDLLEILPQGSILTPHIGEFDRLAGGSNNHYERLEKLMHWSKKLKSIIILKGKYTAISNLDGKIYFNPTGNPGMATAGSGDVLTGMILSLLAQSYLPFDAAKIAVYLHGFSGDLCTRKLTETAMKAGDIITYIPKSFRKLQK